MWILTVRPEQKVSASLLPAVRLQEALSCLKALMKWSKVMGTEKQQGFASVKRGQSGV